jgi:hypothetical protein
VNVSVPLTGPTTAGEKVTPTVQFAPAATLVPHVLLATAKPALVTMLPIASATLSRFVNVTLRTELVVPTVTPEKLIELAESVTGALPVPVRLTACGLSGELSLNVNVPAAAPTAVGEKVTPTVQLAPAAILVPHVLLAAVNPALAAMLVNPSAVV